MSSDMTSSVEPRRSEFVDKLMYDFISICCILESLLLIRVDFFLMTTRVWKYLVGVVILTWHSLPS